MPIDKLADVGERTDLFPNNSLYGKFDGLGKHIHMPAKVYPSLAAGVTVTSGVGLWALGDFAEVIPVNTFNYPFDIHYIFFEAVSANDTYEIALYSGLAGSEVEIGRVRTVRNSVTNSPVPSYFQMPPQTANTRISAKLACAGGNKTATISLQYHSY